MPITPSYPGVYIEEVPSGVRTIVGVSTSVAAFIDFFARGPLNHAVQLFNFGDFQREFGGLHRYSEAAYAIQQFFLNGGQVAWAVRTATAGTYATASITLQDTSGVDILQVQAGRRIKGNSIADPGSWANQLRIDVDYDTTDPGSLFNLTVNEVVWQDGRQIILQTEGYRNLSMDPAVGNYAVETINDESRLIQVTRRTPLSDISTRPAPSGSWGTSVADPIGAISSGDSFNVHYGTSVARADLSFTGSLSTPEQVRRVMESSIRAADRDTPLLADATVKIIRVSEAAFHLQVLAGRRGSAFESALPLTFSDHGGTPATNLGLATAFANVQEYSLGSTLTVGGQKGGTAGADGNLPDELPDAAALLGERSAKTGLYALEDVDLFNILGMPRAADLGETAMQNVFGQAEVYCEERRAILLVDIPAATNTLEEAREWLADNAGLRHQNAAAYFPRPKIPDPLNGFRLRGVGASGTIAGLYARTDSTRGVWKAPAGIEASLRNVPDLDYRLTDQENGQLNPLGLNCLRNFDVHGNVCWGARTLVGADQQASEWKYLPVRRLALFLEESLYRGTQWVVFEPNDEPLWSQIRLNVGAFMHGLFRQGAFQGSSPREAYLVKCDSETTTQTDINRGVVNIVVGFAPLKPAEFVIIQIRQLAGQIES